jgi:arylsulfatase A-like enzyme
MDSLGEDGVWFENCYAQHPVCSPSRVSMFTGLYPHTCGRRTLGTLIRPYEHNLFRDLKEAGYETIVFGKNDMMFPETARLSFNQCEVPVQAKETDRDYPYNEDDRLFYSFLLGKVGKDGESVYRDSDWAIIQSALEFLDKKHKRPFCMLIALSYAHPPYAAPDPFYSMYNRVSVPVPVQVDYDRKRRYARMIHEQYRLDQLTNSDWREIRALYFAMVSRVDYQLGQVIEKLKQKDLWDKTALFVFSDHGDFTGDYGLVEKWFSACEDCILRVPLIMHVPGKVATGRRQALVEMVDLYPTVLDVAKVENRHYHFGRSLLGLYDPNSVDNHRDMVFSEGGHNIDESYIHDISCPYGGVYKKKHRLWYMDPIVMSKAWMVRDKNYKFIYCPEEFDELYDMKSDPHETKNIAADKFMIKRVQRMRNQLFEWMIRTIDYVPEDEDRCDWPKKNRI